MRDISGNTIVIAIVVLICVSMAFVFGLSITHNLDSSSTPLITTVLGGIATTIAALVALLKADQAVVKHDQLKVEVSNGMQKLALDTAMQVSTVEPLDNPEHVDRLRQLIASELQKHDVKYHKEGDGK